jgi:hypothetical protein
MNGRNGGVAYAVQLNVGFEPFDLRPGRSYGCARCRIPRMGLPAVCGDPGWFLVLESPT